ALSRRRRGGARRERAGGVERLLALDYLHYLAVLADDERDAIGEYAHRRRAVGLGQLSAGVGQKGKRQLEAGGELLLRLQVVGRNAQDLGVGAGELRE